MAAAAGRVGKSVASVRMWHRLVDAAIQIPFGESFRDLHVHLDGSIPLDIILQHPAVAALATSSPSGALHAPGPPSSSPHENLQQSIWRRDVSQFQAAVGAVSPQGDTSLGVFDFMNAFLQTVESLQQAAAAAMAPPAAPLVAPHTVTGKCPAESNAPSVISELRFCPVLHTHHGLSAREAVCAVKAAIGEDSILTLCALRHMGMQHFRDILALAEEFQCAVDIAGDEGLAPFQIGSNTQEGEAALSGLKLFVAAAKEGSIPGVTAHAGECPGAHASMLAAAECLRGLPGQARMGHALQFAPEAQTAYQGTLGQLLNLEQLRTLLAEAPCAQALAAKHQCGTALPVEVCLTSNVGGSARRGQPIWYDEHPLPLMVMAGVPIVLCTDNHVTSGNADTGAATLLQEHAHAFVLLTQFALRTGIHQESSAAADVHSSSAAGDEVGVGSVWQSLLRQHGGVLHTANQQDAPLSSRENLVSCMLWAWSYVYEMGVRSHHVSFAASCVHAKSLGYALPSDGAQTQVLHAIAAISQTNDWIEFQNHISLAARPR